MSDPYVSPDNSQERIPLVFMQKILILFVVEIFAETRTLDAFHHL